MTCLVMISFDSERVAEINKIEKGKITAQLVSSK